MGFIGQQLAFSVMLLKTFMYCAVLLLIDRKLIKNYVLLRKHEIYHDFKRYDRNINQKI